MTTTTTYLNPLERLTPFDALYTYACDGSGRDMRCAVTVYPANTCVHAGTGETLVLVRFHEYLPTRDRMREMATYRSSERLVPVNGKFTEIDQDAPLAPFNWLD